MKKKFINDDDLFAAIMRNDDEAKLQLYETIGPPLYGFAFKWIKDKQAAEDIVSLAYCNSLGSGKVFKNLEHVSCYVYAAVKNACIHHKYPTHYISQEEIEETIASDQRIDEDYVRFENRKAVYAQIQALPRKSDRLILLLTMAGHKPAEIAAEIGQSTRYVQKRIRVLAGTIHNKLLIKKIITVLLFLISIK